MKQATTQQYKGPWRWVPRTSLCLLAAGLVVTLATACGTEAADAAGPAADSPYARADTVLLICGLGAAKPGKGWLVRRDGTAADGSMPLAKDAPFREAYRFTAQRGAVDDLFDALWQARFLEVPAGSAGDYG